MITSLLILGLVFTAIYFGARLSDLRDEQNELRELLDHEKSRVDLLERALAAFDARSPGEVKPKEKLRPAKEPPVPAESALVPTAIGPPARAMGEAAVASQAEVRQDVAPDVPKIDEPSTPAPEKTEEVTAPKDLERELLRPAASVSAEPAAKSEDAIPEQPTPEPKPTPEQPTPEQPTPEPKPTPEQPAPEPKLTPEPKPTPERPAPEPKPTPMTPAKAKPPVRDKAPATKAVKSETPAAPADVKTRARMAAAVAASDSAPARGKSMLQTAAGGLGVDFTLPTIGAPRVPTRNELEEQLGARLPVWIGSIALLLAGAFLVKFTFDEEILGPEVRVALGALFGVVLLGGAERMRPGTPRVASGLAAAGIGVLFASFLAATNTFGIVDAKVGFALMALTTAVAVALSLRHGALVAVLGLIGGFMTPLLIQTAADPNAAALFPYLLTLQIGLVVVTRRRGWWQLAGLTLAAGMVWVVLWLRSDFMPGDDIWLGMFLLSSTATFVSAGLYGDATAAWGDKRIPRLMARAAIGLSLLLLAAVTVSAGFKPIDFAFFAVLGAGCIALARIDPSFEEMPWLTGTLTGVLLAAWPLQAAFDTGSPIQIGPISVPDYLLIVGGIGALYACGGYAALWGSVRPARWAALAAMSSVLYLLVGWWGAIATGISAPWGPIALALGAVLVPACALVARKRKTMAEGNLTLSALAAAATAFIGLAVALTLPAEWIAVAWATEAAALTWIAHRLQVPQLRKLVWPLALVVSVRLLNPLMLTHSTGDLPILNWLLYGYGVPILAFAVAARFSHLDGDERLSRMLQWLALVLGFALITAQVRHLFQGQDTFEFSLSLNERATYAAAWLAYSLALLWSDRKWPLTSFRWFGQGLAALGIFTALAVNGLMVNPLWRSESVGLVPGLNWLLWIYGVPGALALLIARELGLKQGLDPRRATIVWLSGFTLLLLLITLEVNQLFHPEQLQLRGADVLERSTYVVAWLLYALALLAIEKRWRHKVVALYGWFVTGLAMVGALVGTILMNPVLTGEGVLGTVLLNQLLWIYGVPAVLTLTVAWLRRDVLEDMPVKVPTTIAAGLFLALALITLEVRHYFHVAALDSPELGFVERGSYVVAWLLFAIALLWFDRRRPVQMVSWFAQLLAAGALATALLFNGLIKNPLWTGEPVGQFYVLNSLLWVYGVPAALALVVARELELRPELDRIRSRLAWLASLTLALLLITLEINHLFHRELVEPFTAALVERGAYVVAWLIFAHVLLAAHRRWNREVLSLYGWFVAAASFALALVTTVVMNPVLMGESVGSYQIINQLLWMYGVPAALMLGLAWTRREVAVDKPIRVPSAIVAGLFLVFVLVTLEVRQWFHTGALDTPDVTFIERGTYVIAWLVMALALLMFDRRRPIQVVNWFAQVLAAFALAIALLVTGLIKNPLWTGESVGKTQILNWLLWVYGVPAGLALAFAREMSMRPELPARRILASWLAALTLTLLLITLEVNHLFHGETLQAFEAGLVERGTYVVAWLAFAFVLMLAGRYWDRRELVLYGWFVTGLGLVTALYSTVLKNPVVTGEPVPGGVLFNTLLWVYGVPAALALAIAWNRRTSAQDLPLRVPATLASGLVLVLALVTLQVRQLFQGEILSAGAPEFGERSAYVVAWMVMALVLLWIEEKWPLKVSGYIAGAIAAVALTLAVVVGLGTGNPVLTGEEVGTLPVLNWLLLAYGVPAVLCLVLAHRVRNIPKFGHYLVLALNGVALLLLFSLVTLEVRQIFHKAVLTGPWDEMEMYSYSLAWILFATALLVVGIVRKSQGPRYASLAIMMLSVAKVFLYDVGNVTDLLRVASFLGLGISLLLLAWLYQRFVFVEEAQ